jgi:glycerophosphoryl diester phosphodiesterase
MTTNTPGRNCELGHNKMFRPGIFFVLLSFVGSNLHAIEIIAHRGASYDAPENTVAAYKLGWKQNADAVELDIWLSKDGKIVCLHDDNTRHTAGADKAVADQTLAGLRALDAGSWKGKEWKGEKLPTLDEVLALIPDGKRLVIEIKCGPEALPELQRLIQTSDKKPQQLVIIGFDYETMVQAKQRFPQIPVLYLRSYKKDKQTGKFPALDELIHKAKAAGLDGLNLNYKWPIDAAFVQKVKSAGLKLYVWTVDNDELAKKLAFAGVDGITTNRPEWLRQKLKTAG